MTYCQFCGEPVDDGQDGIDCGCIDDYDLDNPFPRDRNSPWMNENETWRQPQKGLDI